MPFSEMTSGILGKAYACRSTGLPLVGEDANSELVSLQGIYRRKWKTRMLNLAMLPEDSAWEVPTRTAIVCEETRLSYAELNAATSQVAPQK
jgi:hypothetical protein